MSIVARYCSISQWTGVLNRHEITGRHDCPTQAVFLESKQGKAVLRNKKETVVDSVPSRQIVMSLYNVAL